MVIPDKLYNQIEITDPIIENLINSKPFLRLKDINQYGGVNLVFPDKYQVTRYQHSLGVYHVLKSLRANHEIQIAGLLHDIGHTALSHLYDMALESQTEDNHELIMQNLEGWDEVQNILDKNGLKMMRPDEYVLIKKSLPDIGADRFDYALRDYSFATNEFSDLPIKLLTDIAIDEQGMYFNSLELASKFAEMGNKAMWLVIYDPNIAVVYQSLIEMLRIGIKDGWLSTEDFMKTDKHVVDKIKTRKKLLPEKYIKVLEEKYVVEETDEKHSDFKFMKHKIRYFDPRVKNVNGLVGSPSLIQTLKQA